jgi:hypothetical protein
MDASSGSIDDLVDDSDFSSESSSGFQTNAAVSVVAPAAMQRPPTTMEMDNSRNQGKYVVYLAVPGSNQAATDTLPFVVLANIMQIWREGADLYFGVYDFACDQAQNYLKTITDGSWDVPQPNYLRLNPTGERLSWREINVGVNLVVCILPRKSGGIIDTGGVLPSGTSSLIVSLLRASTHAHAVSFMESEHRERPPTSTTPRVLREPALGRYESRRRAQNKLLGAFPCRAMWPCEIPCYDRGLLAETCARTIVAESCPRARGFRGKYQANLHMLLCHGLSPDDPRFYVGCGHKYYPCKFKVPGEDPCEFRNFKYSFNSNEHMQTSHGLLSDDARLYAEFEPSTVIDPSKRHSKKKMRVRELRAQEQLRQYKISAQLRLRKRGSARQPGEAEVKAPVTAPARMAELLEAAPHPLTPDFDLKSLPGVATTRTMTPTPSSTPSSSSSCSIPWSRSAEDEIKVGLLSATTEMNSLLARTTTRTMTLTPSSTPSSSSSCSIPWSQAKANLVAAVAEMNAAYPTNPRPIKKQRGATSATASGDVEWMDSGTTPVADGNGSDTSDDADAVVSKPNTRPRMGTKSYADEEEQEADSDSSSDTSNDAQAEDPAVSTVAALADQDHPVRKGGGGGGTVGPAPETASTKVASVASGTSTNPTPMPDAEVTDAEDSFLDQVLAVRRSRKREGWMHAITMRLMRAIAVGDKQKQRRAAYAASLGFTTVTPPPVPDAVPPTILTQLLESNIQCYKCLKSFDNPWCCDCDTNEDKEMEEDISFLRSLKAAGDAADDAAGDAGGGPRARRGLCVHPGHTRELQVPL